MKAVALACTLIALVTGPATALDPCGPGHMLEAKVRGGTLELQWVGKIVDQMSGDIAAEFDRHKRHASTVSLSLHSCGGAALHATHDRRTGANQGQPRVDDTRRTGWSLWLGLRACLSGWHAACWRSDELVFLSSRSFRPKRRRPGNASGKGLHFSSGRRRRTTSSAATSSPLGSPMTGCNSCDERCALTICGKAAVTYGSRRAGC